MRISAELGRLINELRGASSFGTMAIKTGVSKAYLVELAKGKVPRPERLEMIAAAYPEHASELFRLAGYPLPDRFRGQPQDVKAACLMALRTGALSKQDAEDIMAVVDDILTCDNHNHQC